MRQCYVLSQKYDRLWNLLNAENFIIGIEYTGNNEHLHEFKVEPNKMNLLKMYRYKDHIIILNGKTNDCSFTKKENFIKHCKEMCLYWIVDDR